MFRPDLADPAVEARVVLEGVIAPERDPEDPERPPRPFSASASTVLALTQDGELVSVDPHTGDPTVLRSEVRSFVASADLRWVLWQVGLPDTEPPELGTLRLLDRESGEDVFEGVGSSSSSHTDITGDMVRIVRDDDSTRLVMLPSLLQLDVGPEWHVLARHPSGIVLMKPSESEGRVALDPETRELWSLLGGSVINVEYVGDEELILNEEHTSRDFSYWRVSIIRGGEPELLAAHVLAPVWLPDGRIGSTTVDEGSYHGQLRIVDLETNEFTVLDDDVFWRALGPRTLRGHPWLYDEDVVLWSVHDGGRSGVWAARIK